METREMTADEIKAEIDLIVEFLLTECTAEELTPFIDTLREQTETLRQKIAVRTVKNCGYDGVWVREYNTGDTRGYEGFLMFNYSRENGLHTERRGGETITEVFETLAEMAKRDVRR